jgi:hypothetical protein
VVGIVVVVDIKETTSFGEKYHYIPALTYIVAINNGGYNKLITVSAATTIEVEEA